MQKSGKVIAVHGISIRKNTDRRGSLTRLSPPAVRIRGNPKGGISRVPLLRCPVKDYSRSMTGLLGSMPAAGTSDDPPAYDHIGM